jgi:hypothetical protein
MRQAEMKEWEALTDAARIQVKQQQEFCQWWQDTVHRKGGERWIDGDVRRYQEMPASEAEKLTDISHQQVSDWRKLLEHVDRYRSTQ